MTVIAPARDALSANLDTIEQTMNCYVLFATNLIQYDQRKWMEQGFAQSVLNSVMLVETMGCAQNAGMDTT